MDYKLDLATDTPQRVIAEALNSFNYRQMRNYAARLVDCLDCTSLTIEDVANALSAMAESDLRDDR